MEATHQCNICKEKLGVENALEHLSAVHGIVYGEVENSEFSKEENDAVTEHLMNIKGSKINN
jgi:hypothetical protein